MSNFAAISTVRIIKLQLFTTKELVYLSQFTPNGNDIIEFCRQWEKGVGVRQSVRNDAMRAVREALNELKRAYRPGWIEEPLWHRLYAEIKPLKIPHDPL